MSIEIKVFCAMAALIGSASAFKIEASGLDEWGLHGASKDAIIVPDTDYSFGGNSFVLDPVGGVVGPCPQNDATCTANWNMSNTFVEVDWIINHFSSKLKITDWVPSSKDGWGWARAGWWVIPSYDATISGETAFDKSKAAGLTSDSWLSMVISYTAGETLKLELKGEDIDEGDALQSPPRFSYRGTGEFEVVNFPMSAVKRAGWSVPASYDAAKVSAVGFLRLEGALSHGAQFPSNAPLATDFKFKCISSGTSQGDNSCDLGTIPLSSSYYELSSVSPSSSALSSSSSQIMGSNNFKIEASGLDEWGLFGNSKDAIVVPYTDFESGGDSKILDPSGAIVGPCPKLDNTCTANWNMSNTFVKVGLATNHFSSKLQVTDYVPSSRAGWGWATSGWWMIPRYNAAASGSTAFQKANVIGLTQNSWLSMEISYTAGQTLTLELGGPDIDLDDPQQSPPRFSYEGTGDFEVIRFPMTAIKRAGWSVPATYDASRVTSIGLLRQEFSLAEGAQFPSAAPRTTDFKFKCLASGDSVGHNNCGDNYIYSSSNISSYTASSSSSYNNPLNFKIEARGLDKWGVHDAGKNAIVVPDSDIPSGGNSEVLDLAGDVIGYCSATDCTQNWDISNTLVSGTSGDVYLSSELKVTDFVPSSRNGWGWGVAAWWIIPNYDASRVGQDAFDKAGPAGLMDHSWISMVLSYSDNEILTFQLAGEDINLNDGQQSPPRFSYLGTGEFENIQFPMSAVKRAGWSIPATYDVTKVTQIGVMRMEAALAEGAAFPSSAPRVTSFKFRCIGSSDSKGDNPCAGVSTMNGVQKTSYIEDVTKDYEFSSFSIFLSQFFSGDSVVYNVKSLYGTTNPVLSGPVLSVNSLTGKSGVDFIEIEAFNNLGSVRDTFRITVSELKIDVPVLKDTIADIQKYEEGYKGTTEIDLGEYFESDSDISYSITRIKGGSGPLPTIVDGKLYLPEASDFVGIEVYEITATNLEGTLKLRFKVSYNAGINSILSSYRTSLVGTDVKVYSIEGQEVWSGVWTETPMLIPGNYIIKSKGQNIKYSIK